MRAGKVNPCWGAKGEQPATATRQEGVDRVAGGGGACEAGDACGVEAGEGDRWEGCDRAEGRRADLAAGASRGEQLASASMIGREGRRVRGERGEKRERGWYPSFEDLEVTTPCSVCSERG